MEKKYIWDGDDYGEHEFTVTRPNDCSIEVTKDECSVTISADELSNMYILAFSDGKGFREQKNCAVKMAVGLACKMILDRPKYDLRYNKLCSNLENFYNKL